MRYYSLQWTEAITWKSLLPHQILPLVVNAGGVSPAARANTFRSQNKNAKHYNIIILCNNNTLKYLITITNVKFFNIFRW